MLPAGWSLPSDRHIFNVPLFLEHQSYFRWCKVHFNHKTLMKLLDTTKIIFAYFCPKKKHHNNQRLVWFFVPKTTGVFRDSPRFHQPKRYHKSHFQPLVLPCPTKPLILSSCVPCHRCLGFLKKKHLLAKLARRKRMIFWGLGRIWCVCFFWGRISIPVNAHNMFTL